MAVLPKRWRFCRNDGGFTETMAVWVGHGTPCPLRVAVLPERWRFCRNDGGFAETMAVLPKLQLGNSYAVEISVSATPRNRRRFV
jgi:hypothetical protein